MPRRRWPWRSDRSQPQSASSTDPTSAATALTASTAPFASHETTASTGVSSDHSTQAEGAGDQIMASVGAEGSNAADTDDDGASVASQDSGSEASSTALHSINDVDDDALLTVAEHVSDLSKARLARIRACHERLRAGNQEALEAALVQLIEQYKDEIKRWKGGDRPSWLRIVEDLRTFLPDEQAIRDFRKGRKSLAELSSLRLFAEITRAGRLKAECTIIYKGINIPRPVDFSTNLIVYPEEFGVKWVGYEEGKAPSWILFAESYDIARPFLALVDRWRDREGEGETALPGVDWKGAVLFSNGDVSGTLQRQLAWLALKAPKRTPVFGIASLSGSGLRRWRTMMESRFAPRLHHAQWLGGDVNNLVHTLESKGQLELYARGQSASERETLDELAAAQEPWLRETAETARDLLELGFSLPVTPLGDEIVDRFLTALKRHQQPAYRKQFDALEDLAFAEASGFDWEDEDLICKASWAGASYGYNRSTREERFLKREREEQEDEEYQEWLEKQE